MSTAEIQTLPMTASEARQSVERIRAKLDQVRRLVYDFWTRDGWKALKYRSWSECVQEEFAEHRSHLYHQLDAARIEVLLSTDVDKELFIGSIPEGKLRPMAKLLDRPDELRAAWALANETTGGKPTGPAVAEAVDQVLANWESSEDDEGEEEETEGDGDETSEADDGDGSDPNDEGQDEEEEDFALQGTPEPEPAKPSKFNQTNEMVDWARWTWNPVTGCEHNCVYCYARDIAEKLYPEKFAPTFRPERLNAPQHTRRPDVRTDDPVQRTAWKNVFVCSMADLFGRWVPREWIDAVFDSCRKSPEWNYLFLTKFPNRYDGLKLPPTAWLGTSIDEQKRVANAEKSFAKIKAPVKWLSVEPMRERLTFSRLDLFDWVVIGGQSRSSGAPQFHPPFDWVADLWHEAKAAGCAVYFKPNTWPGAAGWLPKEYPKAMTGEL